MHKEIIFDPEILRGSLRHAYVYFLYSNLDLQVFQDGFIFIFMRSWVHQIGRRIEFIEWSEDPDLMPYFL